MPVIKPKPNSSIKETSKEKLETDQSTVDIEKFFHPKTDNTSEPQFGNYFKVYSQILQIDDLTLTERLILALMLSFWGTGNDFFTKNSYLEKTLNIGKSTVTRALSNLRNKGYIQKSFFKEHKRYINGTKKTFDVYKKCLKKHTKKQIANPQKRKENVRF